MHLKNQTEPTFRWNFIQDLPARTTRLFWDFTRLLPRWIFTYCAVRYFLLCI